MSVTQKDFEAEALAIHKHLSQTVPAPLLAVYLHERGEYLSSQNPRFKMGMFIHTCATGELTKGAHNGDSD